MEQYDVSKKIHKALEILYERDNYLLMHDANEVSISHKLACYLQYLFKDYDVDIEFNRNLDDPKIVHDEGDSRIIPDIIIHKRGINTNNFIVIEIKKSNNRNKNKDPIKIKK
jgi:hypothetical protein